jgi:CRP-like cAMP-binding protein
MNRIEFLQRSELFHGVPGELVEHVVGQMTEVRVGAGEPVFKAGEPGDAVYVVVEGQLQLVAGGVNLLTRSRGECVGEFALIDDEPRSATALPLTDVTLLRWERGEFQRTLSHHPSVARSIFRMLTGKLRQDVTSKVETRLAQERWEQDLARAREIQLGMLPRSHHRLRHAEIASHFDAAVAVAGDYFDYLALDHGRFGVVVADVTGHGFYSGLFVAMAKSCLHTHARFAYHPAEVMAALRRTMDLSLGSRLLMACFYAVVDPAAGRLCYVNAGHPFPLRLRPSTGELTRLEPEDPILGALAVDEVDFVERECDWREGDLLVLYSDGLTECRAPDGSMLGVEALEACVRASDGTSAAGLKAEILATMEHHARGVPPDDDVTLLVVRAVPPPEEGR